MMDDVLANQSELGGDLREGDKIHTAGRLGTRDGVSALLASEAARYRSSLVAARYGPEYAHTHELPKFIWSNDVRYINSIDAVVSERIKTLTQSEGQIAGYLSLQQYEIRCLAHDLATTSHLGDKQKIVWAEAILGSEIPGDSAESKYARTCSAVFWRRALSVKILRAREHLYLRMALIGTGSERYVSNDGVDSREYQLAVQKKWMRQTVLVRQGNQSDGESEAVELNLADFAKGPKERFAKLYSFINAIDALGTQSRLDSAMVTITLEPHWHPNPSNGASRWDGASPRDAHRSFCLRWQAVLRDPHRLNIRMSGFRVVEPHKDSCPHYHIWTLFRPEHERRIVATIMKYFPNRLKLRGGSEDTGSDIYFEDGEQYLAGNRVSSPPKNLGAQVDFTKIDRSKGKGSSYLTKYLMETVDSKGEFNGQVDWVDEEGGDCSKRDTTKRVDTFRSVWGINQGQLFGVAKCLTVWDEFRRMNKPPEHHLLRNLWALARGGESEGRIENGAYQRGDAAGFLTALGGLDAAKSGRFKPAKRLMVGRLIEGGINRYGDAIERTVGITLSVKERKKVRKHGENSIFRQSMWRTITEVIASVRTKLHKWIAVLKDSPCRTAQFPKVPSSVPS
jgi:hypothetical protein